MTPKKLFLLSTSRGEVGNLMASHMADENR